MYIAIETVLFKESRRLSARRAIADGYCLDGVSIDHGEHLACCATGVALGRMRIDSLEMEQCALCVETNHLATGAETRVYTHDTLLSERSSKKKLAQVFSEYADSLLIGSLFARHGELCLDGRLE